MIATPRRDELRRNEKAVAGATHAAPPKILNASSLGNVDYTRHLYVNLYVKRQSLAITKNQRPFERQ
jgi:hypothetical protein